MILAPFAHAQFVHPGALSTQADLDRMAAKVAAGAQPWKGGWDILVGNQGFYMGGPFAVPTVVVDSATSGNTYMNLARDSHRAYQAALRYHGSGDPIYADQAVRIMNAWATTHTAWEGNSNVQLRAGLYGYAFACAGELMRGYSGWAPADFAAFQQYMLAQFYPINSAFLKGQGGTHYWANWTLANMCSMIAIGVLCDSQTIFDEALNHFYNAVHTGAINNMVVYVHPDGLGQWQESGRDQGHAQIGPQLIGVFCEIAWNQGHDLYGFLNNRVLSGVEYISKYNTGHAVPFVAYANSDYATWPHVYRFYQKEVAGPGGVGRPGWDLIYNHYVNRRGISAPYTGKYAAATRPEGGGSNYGGNSGGFDGLGFTTLTHSLDPIAAGAIPGALLPRVQGRQITLSWAGSAYAQSYNVKRSTTSGGPYTTLGKVDGDDLFFVDPGLTAGTTYYYVVSANNPGGESADSVEAAATTDDQLFGTVIGSDYSYDHCGATKEILFDGSLENFIDIGGSGGGWSGLDLGSGVSAVITSVKYCPRKNFANRMIGGKFQASNTADFSSGVIDLFTIATAPPEGVLTTQTVNSGSAYRYVRYIQPANVWNTAAEVQFLGTVSGQSAPSAPIATATLVNGLQIDLSWNAVSGATGYRIKRSTTPGGPYVVWGDVNTGYKEKTRFSDIKTELGTTYYYVVSAYNQFGESAPSAQLACATLPTTPQLVTHLKMSGNVADSSGYNFQGNAIGSPDYPGGGYVGSSIDLDGVDDFVTLPRVANSEDITVAAWVNWDGGAAWQRIFDFGTGTPDYLYLTPSSGNGLLRFGIKRGGTEQVVETTPALPIGVWTHVAVTLSGDTATLYVNGSPVASNPAVTTNPSDFDPWANFIGKSQWGGDPRFNGRIDEFRVYNYALSAGNVAALAAQATEATPPAIPLGLNSTAGDKMVQLDWTDNGEPDLHSYKVYRSTTSGSGYSVIASGLTASAYTDTTVSNGVPYFYVVTAVDTSGGESAKSNEIRATPRGTPVLHYQWEGDLLDSSGKGNHATATGSPTYVAGQSGQAIDLNGSNQYLRIPSGVIGTVDSMTIAAWVNWDGGGIWQRIFDFGDGTSRYMFLSPSAGGGKLRFSFNNGKGEKIAETSVLPTGTWVHVAVTLSGWTTKLYVNGVAVATTEASINPTGFDFEPLNSYIGKSQFAADPLFNGRIDDFRIYDYPLTSSQINDIKNGGSPGDDSTPPEAPASLAALVEGSNISLDWADSTEPDFASYSVYRSTTSGSGYTRIATGLTASAYTDTTATGGVTYYYVVTAADTAANESANSAEISATSDTLALHLKFDETEGTVAADSSGNNRHATLVNGPVFASGKINNGLNLTPASSQYVTLPSGIVGDLNDFTISTWVKVNAFATWQRIFDFGTGTNNYMFLTTQYTPTAPNNAKLRFGIRTPTVSEQTVSGTGIALTADAWTHVAVTRSGTTVSLYVNGALAGSGTITSSPSDLGVTTLNYLGKSQFNDPYLNAALDDFRIYSQAMDADQIAHLLTDEATVPQAVSATGGDSQILLSWQAVSSATDYNVKRSTVAGGPYTVLAVTSTTAYTDTDLPAGTTYYYVVSANNASGESADSLQASATTIPAAPADLTSANTNGQVTLSWNASPGAASYTIRRGTSPDGPFVTIATGVTGTSYIDTTAQAGVTYYYTVSASNASGESGASASVPATAPITAVTWLKFDETSGTTAADAIGDGDGTLVNGPAWTGGRIGNGLGFNGTNHHVTLPTGVVSSLQNFTIASWVYWNGGGNWQRVFDFGSGTNNYLFLTPKNGANSRIRFAIRTAAVNEQVIDGTAALPTAGWHHVAVTLSGSTGTLYLNGQQVGQNTAMTLRPSDLGATTQNRLGRSQFNDPYFSGRIDDFRIYASALGAAEIAALASPLQTTGLTASGEMGQIHLAWDATPDASSYTVRRATASGGPYATLASALADTAYTDTGATEGATYFYVVTPRNSVSGDGANSAEVSATAIALAPGNLAATAGAGRLDLTWTASGVATGYLVKRSLVSGGPYTTIATLGATTSYSDTGLVDGNPYHYIVTAVDGAVEIADSAELTAIPGVASTDWFTELFGTNDANDTANTSYTFTPAANANGYIVARAVATAFSTDPAGGTTLNLGDDANTAVALSGGKQVSLFGTAYSTLYVCSNGYVTFGSGDNPYTESLANHFNRPRVSALFDDLDPSSGGTISWKQLADRVAVTWQAVPEYGSANSNNFQVELFFDGRIRITILSIAARDGLIGLSRGTGTPSGFVESNFSAYASLPAAPTAVSASGGPGRIVLNWNAVPGATGYRIKRSSVVGGPYTLLAVSATAGYSDSPLPNETTYHYIVSTVSPVGEGPGTAPVSGTTYTAREAWRFTHFGTAADSGIAADAADPDGDGMTNAEEYAAGTVPTDPASVLRASVAIDGDDIVVSFPSVAGKTYRIEYSDTLAVGSWSPLLDEIAGTGGVVEVADTGAAALPKRFYRILLFP